MREEIQFIMLNAPIKALATVRRNSDGIERSFHSPIGFRGDVDWFDGALSCDCWRRELFCQAEGEVDSETGHCTSGNYSIHLTDSEGHILYSEFGAEIIRFVGLDLAPMEAAAADETPLLRSWYRRAARIAKSLLAAPQKAAEIR